MQVRPATIADLVRLLEARAELTLSAKRYRRLVVQVALSRSFVVTDETDSEVVALGGIAPLDACAFSCPSCRRHASGMGNRRRAGEIWFGATARGLGCFAIGVIRTTQQVLRSVAPDYPAGLMCFVRPGNVQGEHLARLIGCRPSAVMLDGHREWVWAK